MYVVYGTSTCKYCDQAKDLLTKTEHVFEFKNIEDPKFFSEYLSRFPGKKTVPQITYDGPALNTYIGGYEDLLKHITY